MKTPCWVFDTNVVVSGLLVARGYSGRLIDAMLAGAIRLTYDDRIEAEYREVLARPRFAFSPVRCEAFLAWLQQQNHATVASAWEGPPLPDPEDSPFLELALLATDRVLVTGNTKHFPHACRQTVQVLTPREAWLKRMAT